MLARSRQIHESENSSCRLRCNTECDDLNPVPLINKMGLTKSNLVTVRWIPLVLNVLGAAVYLGIFYPLNTDGYKYIGKTGFFCKDPNLSYKHKGDTLLLKQVLIASTFIPILYLLLLEPIRYLRFSKQRLLNLGCLWWDYIVSGSIGWGLSTISKIMVQNPRPDFFDQCRPDTAENCTLGVYVESFNQCLNMVNNTNRDFTTWMSVSSFPSGHSMLAVYCSIFCSYLIESRFPTHRVSMALKGLLHILSLTWATIGILTRYTDRRHHCLDIVVGTTLGVVNAMYIIYLANTRYNLATAEVTVRKGYARNNVCSCENSNN